MKIAQIAPVVERVPPKTYGGTERVVSALTEELVKRGHDVTLFASADSITNARLIATTPKALRELHQDGFNEKTLRTLTHVGLAYSLQEEFDILHDHTGPHSLPLATLSKTPVIVTLHGAFNALNAPLYTTLNNHFNPYFVSISDAQREPLPQLNYIRTVYNGLPMEQYPFSSRHDGYLLFVGRLSMEKGVHYAIEAAKKLKLPLIIAAKLEKVYYSYFRKYIKPQLSDTIQWIGEVTEKERNRLMSKALCFLHPVTWREPFGLTLIESMATGCPVVAFNQGSIPEIIQHGKTGFVVKNVDEMVRMVKKIGSISRKVCRDYASSTFTATKMADDYERVYRKVLFNGFKSAPLIKAPLVRHAYSDLS